MGRKQNQVWCLGSLTLATHPCIGRTYPTLSWHSAGRGELPNSRNQIILNDFSSLVDGELVTDPIALIIKPNDFFKCSGPIYQPLASFNNKITSTESSHYHDLDLIGQFVSGSVGGFVEVLSATVEFDVENSDLFSSPLVQQDGTLFSEARIRFFNPQLIGIEYFSEVISHTSTTLKVKILNMDANVYDVTGKCLYLVILIAGDIRKCKTLRFFQLGEKKCKQ